MVEMLSVPDKREEIYETVDYAMQEADLIIVTGGLGPTKDDVTKKVLAEYFGSRLVMNEEAMGWLKELLGGRGIALNENNRSQAIIAVFSETIRVRLPECGLNGAGSL